MAWLETNNRINGFRLSPHSQNIALQVLMVDSICSANQLLIRYKPRGLSWWQMKFAQAL
jgi:hypothetical protein